MIYRISIWLDFQIFESKQNSEQKLFAVNWKFGVKLVSLHRDNTVRAYIKVSNIWILY